MFFVFFSLSSSSSLRTFISHIMGLSKQFGTHEELPWRGARRAKLAYFLIWSI